MLSGSGFKGVVLVSETDIKGSHWMLERLINRAGLNKSDFYFASLQTPNLVESFKHHNVQVVVGLGEHVLNALSGERDILRWRGRVLEWPGRYFIPTLAPHKLLPENPNSSEVLRLKAMGFSPLLNPPRFQGTFMLDLQYALHVAQHGFTRKIPHYTVDPSPEEFREWALHYLDELKKNPKLKLSADIETPYKQKTKNEDDFEESEAITGNIIRTSYTFKEYEGLSIPHLPPYYDTIKDILGSNGIKVFWNGLAFDIPILNKESFEVKGEIWDGMDMFHLYQSDLPKGLEYVSSYTSDLLPWKHLNNTDPGLYSAIDPDAALRNVNWLEAKLIKTGQFQTWMNHYVRLSPVIISAGKRGNYIDIPYRDALEAEASALLAAKVQDIQKYIPREVKPRKVYLSPPKDEWFKYKDVSNHRVMPPVVFDGGNEYDVVEVEEDVKRCSICGAIATNKSEHFANLKGEQKRDKKGNLRFGKNGNPLYESIPSPCKGGEIQISQGIRYHYHQILDFNPNSSEQLKDYARYHGHPIGENKRDSDKESMDASHIQTLVKKFGSKHPLYKEVLEIHKLKKTLGTYIYTPDEDGLIHTTYKNVPSTPRFSSANVNLQNVGKRADNPWATKARKQIIARPGFRFVQSDSSAIEAVVQGWWMGDENYMDLATKSIHAWVVAQEVGIEWKDGSPEVVDFIKHEYKDMYNKMKTTNYLCLTGEHEILTPSGWVRFDQYDGKSPIAQWNTDGTLSFQSPSYFLDKEYEGDMFVLDGRSLKAMATPKHAFPARSDNRGPYKRTIVDDINPNHRVPFAGKLEGTQEVDPVALQLMVAIQADGTLLPTGDVKFTLRKTRKIARLERLLSERPYRKTMCGLNTVITLKRNDITDVLELFACRKLFNEEWLISLTTDLRELFLSELLHWDGSIRGLDGNNQNVYRTMVEQNAQIVQTIAHITGRQGVLTQHKTTRMWSVSFNNRQETRLPRTHKSVVPFKGRVYCVTTDTGYFLYRYKGVVAVSGNTNFGGGAYLMWKSFPDVFPTKEIAQATQDKLYEKLPKLKSFHEWVRSKAHKESYLELPGWKHRHYYYDVFHGVDYKGNPKFGKDAKRVCAFFPQGCAAAFMRDNLLLMAYGDKACEWLGIQPLGLSRGWLEYMPANLVVHDGYTLEVPDGLELIAAQDMEMILTRPIPQLDGLRIGCETDVSEVGGNWAPYDEVENPSGLKTIHTVRVEPILNRDRLVA